MTEAEAKTKWCPKAGESRFARQDEFCLGTACAVWRWSGPTPSGGGFGTADAAITILGTDDQRRQLRAELEAKRPGYCGLAPIPAKVTHP